MRLKKGINIIDQHDKFGFYCNGKFGGNFCAETARKPIEDLSKLFEKLRKNKNLNRIESDYSRDKPEIKLSINKNRAKDLGISSDSIGKTLETLYGGKTVTKFNKLGKEYPIRLIQ